MLEFFRERMQGAFATAIVVFFCAVFALWGVEALFQGGGKKDAVATVNEQDISERELANAIQILRAQYTKMLGGQVDANFLNDKMLRQPALESLISRKLLEDFVEDKKMIVSKQTIDKAIVADKTFSRDGKTFDPEYYKERLRDSGMTAAVYQQQLGKQLVLQHLQNGIASTAFVTDAEIRDIARLMAQKRSFDYIRFPLKSFSEAIQVSDEEVEKYYNEHQSDFMNDEQVAIEYLEINKKSVADSIQVEEADIQHAYDKEAANFKPLTERSAAHILLEVKEDGSHEARLAEIQSRLGKGEKFEDLAKAFSVDEGSASQGGDVGFTSGETFVPEFEKALAGLANVGDVSAPVKTEFGYHIIKLTGKRETAMKSFDERKADIANELRGGQAKTLFNEKIDALGESTYSAGDLSGPAQELGLTTQKTALFSRRGGPGIAGDQKVIETAFSADMVESGKNSQVIELTGDRAIVLRVSEHVLPKVRELVDVKPAIVEAVKREKAATQLKEKMAALKIRAENEKTLAGIANDDKMEVAAVVSATRKDGKGDQVDIFDSVFAMARPDTGAVVVDAINTPSGDWALVMLKSVEDKDVTADSPEFAEVKSRLMQSSKDEAFAVFEKELQKKAKITRYESKAEPEKE